jgi:flagellar basal-body rod modification protein FlgD
MTTVNATAAPISTDLMTAVNAKKAEAANGSVQADTDKFMTLLVTQLKNQDPLNPLDNAQITSQLAQLSTVTGVNKLNTTLESLKASYQSSESLAATNMIGHGVLVAGSDIALQGGKSIFGVELASAADKVQVIIMDPRSGKDVASMDLGARQPGIVPLAWDGAADKAPLDASGKPVALRDGKYLFRIVASRGGEELKDAAALRFDSVGSVTTNGKNGVRMNLAQGGTSVALTDIKQVL